MTSAATRWASTDVWVVARSAYLAASSHPTSVSSGVARQP